MNLREHEKLRETEEEKLSFTEAKPQLLRLLTVRTYKIYTKDQSTQ